MLISIIVPVYNIENYIEKCVDSLLQQAKHNFNVEIILVDDGSIDKCPLICDRYAAKNENVKVIHKKNGGLISARITGLKSAAGDHVMFVDGDDWLTDNCLQKLWQQFNQHPETDLICFGARYCMADRSDEAGVGATPGFYGRERLEQFIFPKLIENENGVCFSSNVWGKLFRRDYLEACYEAVDERITMGEDLAVTKPYIYKCSSMYIMKDCLYCYNRANVSSMTSTLRPISWDNNLMIRKILLDCFGRQEYWISQINRYTIHALFTTSVSRFNSGQLYFAVSKDIKSHLRNPEYAGIFQTRLYKKPLNKAVTFILGHKWVLPIYLYWRFVRS